jgi:heme A synthase
MAGAMVATLLLLVLTVQLLQNFPAHPTLRPVAIASMSVLLLQVTLGIAAFVMRLLDFDTNTGFVFLTAAHVCVGALTLAASVVMCLEVRRCCVIREPVTSSH